MDTSFQISELVLNAREPYVLKQIEIPWECFKLSFEAWCNKFDKEISNRKIEFEKGSNLNCAGPHWEKYRKKEMMTVKEFLNFCKSSEENNSNEEWLTYSYKDIKEIPNSCRTGVDFSALGFSTLKDVSFWLSSKGAHTPCHYDTYGCNIVVQVYGRKMWLLFPPDALLTPVRVPYEESSVYCSETFYNPRDMSQFRFVDKDAFKCVLNPGDVLIVPNKWWHYVESLTASLSINTWIPLKLDNGARLEECIVRYVLGKFTANGDDAELKFLLNPNEVGKLENETLCLRILHYLTQQCKEEDCNKLEQLYDYQYIDKRNLHTLERTFNAEKIENLSKNEFYYFLRNRSSHSILEHNDPITIDICVKQALINAICNPSLIAKVKLLFLKYLEISPKIEKK